MKPLARDLGIVALAKIAASVVVLASGFLAVSDDDYARVVIAEQWAHAPKLDPSGTSWLPAPFWMYGSVMLLLGRSLTVARGTAFVLGVASALVIYVAARWICGEREEDRWPAVAGAVVAAIFPWSARLGAATVPELPTAALMLLGMAAVVPVDDPSEGRRRRMWGAVALLLATLSRYEAWPVAAAVAALSMYDAARRPREAATARAWAAPALAVAGPLAWIWWNAHAHGAAFAFAGRVAAYKKAVGEQTDGFVASLAGYFLTMLRDEPELFTLVAVLGVAVLWERRDPNGLRLGARFGRPVVIAFVVTLVLGVAAARDGAPTHHPGRAMLAVLLLAAVAVGALIARLSMRGPARSMVRLGAAATLAVAAGALVRARGGADNFALRRDEASIGAAAGRVVGHGDLVLVEVVDYGHLAVAAAFGRPELLVRDRDIDPRLAPTASSFESEEALARRVADARAAFFIGRTDGVAAVVGGEPAARRDGWGLWPSPRGGTR